MTVCSVCHHPKRVEIDKALITGTSLRDAEGRWDIAKSAVHRHKQRCIKQAVIAAQKENTRLLVTAVQKMVAPPPEPPPDPGPRLVLRSSLEIWDEINKEILDCAEAISKAKRGGILALRIKHLELYTKLTGDYYQAGENPHDRKRKQEEAIKSYQDQVEQECGARPPRPEAIAALAEQHQDFKHVN